MKVSIGMNIQTGPWGGGNQFGRSLSDYLAAKGVEVSHDLSTPDLDIILLTEPRIALKSSAYSHREISRYLRRKNTKAIVVHRINECDERKGSKGTNRLLIEANTCADHTVFISTWIRDLFLGQGLKTPGYSVILNGAGSGIFNPEGYTRWNGQGKLRLVTHHWGGGYLKGFDIYERLDSMLSDTSWGGLIDFTFIGNVPEGFRFRNACHLPPKSGKDLARALCGSHVYLTASQNEPAGMHHIEGALCGLPLLYRRSGALPEYCSSFGISFEPPDFEERLEEMIRTYGSWADRMHEYPHTAARMCEDYFSLFTALLGKRDELLRSRHSLQRRLRLLRMNLGSLASIFRHP